MEKTRKREILDPIGLFCSFGEDAEMISCSVLEFSALY